MPKSTTIDAWLTANLPGYRIEDFIKIDKWWRSVTGNVTGIRKNWAEFKTWLVNDWLGAEYEMEPYVEPAPLTEQQKANIKEWIKNVEADREKGACSCGGRFVLRTNRAKGNQFYGCSNWPQCTKTKQI